MFGLLLQKFVYSWTIGVYLFTIHYYCYIPNVCPNSNTEQILKNNA